MDLLSYKATIITALLNDFSVSTLVGGNIYTSFPDMKSLYPCITVLYSGGNGLNYRLNERTLQVSIVALSKGSATKQGWEHSCDIISAIIRVFENDDSIKISGSRILKVRMLEGPVDLKPDETGSPVGIRLKYEISVS